MADALYNAILGEETPKAVSSSSVGGGVITDQILDSLKRVESGKDRYALNKESKAMGSYQFIPETVQMLHKQGIEFNPFNEKESRQAAKTYLEQLVKQKGSVEGALAAYGGHITKDPTAYVSNVMGGAKKESPASNDALYNAILGDESTTQPTVQPSAKTEEVKKPLSFMEKFAQISGKATETNKPLAEGISSLADTVYGVVPAAVGGVTYAAGRALGQTPEEAQKTSGKVSGFLENPLGKALGTTESAAYKGEAAKQAMEAIGQYLGESADTISKKTGIPKADVENMIQTLSFAAPEVAGRIKAKAVPAVSKFLEERKMTPEEMKGQFEAKGGKTQAEVVSEIPKGTAKPYEAARDFTPVEYAENVLPKDEQIARAEVLHRIDPNLKVDPSVIEGRGKLRATDYQLSKTDTSEGNLIAEKLKEEKRALNNYGERLISESGGTSGLDETSNYKRGNNQIEYFQKLETHFDNAIKKIYTERDKLAKDIPVNGENIKSALTDDVTLSLGDNQKLANAANAKLKQLGMMDKDGNMLPSNGYTAEQFRKWLNEPNVWDRQNAVLHRALKGAVDEDVISTLDPKSPIYKEARDLHGLKKDTLENPNGISRILDAEGPNQINRKVDIEKIPNSIAGLGVDQSTHILNTINNAPKELKPLAEKARSEIKSQFLNRTHEAFQKSPNAGTKYLRDNKEVMTRWFTPEEMSKINDYNSAAHILKTETGYPGAKVQEINIEKRLPTKIKEQFIKKGGAAISEVLTGGHTFGMAGTTTHEAIGGHYARKEAKALEKLHKQNLEKKKSGYVNLNDILGKK